MMEEDGNHGRNDVGSEFKDGDGDIGGHAASASETSGQLEDISMGHEMGRTIGTIPEQLNEDTSKSLEIEQDYGDDDDDDDGGDGDGDNNNNAEKALLAPLMLSSASSGGGADNEIRSRKRTTSDDNDDYDHINSNGNPRRSPKHFYNKRQEKMRECCEKALEIQRNILRNTISFMNFLAKLLFWLSLVAMAVGVIWYSRELAVNG